MQKDIVYVMLSFRQMNTRLLYEFGLDKPSHISISDNTSTKKRLNIPISTNETSLGKPLITEVVNGFVTNINIIIKNKLVNFIDIIKSKAKFLRTNHKDNITSFDSNFKFYLLNEKYDYVLAVKVLYKNYAIKFRYSLSGVLVNSVKDNIENDLVVRNVGEKEIIFKNNNVFLIKQNIKLKAIDKPKKKILFVENKNIGVIDS